MSTRIMFLDSNVRLYRDDNQDILGAGFCRRAHLDAPDALLTK